MTPASVEGLARAGHENRPERAHISLRTPAKINLGLRITGRRGDGYHLLESVFAPIDLYDEIEVEITPGPDSIDLKLVESADNDLPQALRVVTDGADNLVVRAAQAFREATGLRGRIGLTLAKGIPAGAGLGGGSSDAAAVLRGLASLAGERTVGSDRLEEIALGLGADVPFFLAPRPALVTGIGEHIEPLPQLPGLDLVIANPGISVATAEVYRVADALSDSLTPPGAGSTMRAILRLSGEEEDWAPALGDLLVNHLEPAAIRLCPPIGRLMGRMRAVGAVGVSLSGSGATVFGVFRSAAQAREAAEILRSSNGSGSSRTGISTESPTEARAATSEAAKEVGRDEVWARVTRIVTPG